MSSIHSAPLHFKCCKDYMCGHEWCTCEAHPHAIRNEEVRKLVTGVLMKRRIMDMDLKASTLAAIFPPTIVTRRARVLELLRSLSANGGTSSIAKQILLMGQVKDVVELVALIYEDSRDAAYLTALFGFCDQIF